ncbi:MAG: DUF1552 domain-containing protein [Polyangiaceae bacterium]
MKWNKTSRRFFLQGAGATLTLPVLASLMPETAKAQSAPKSFIGIGAWNGLYRMYGPQAELMPQTPESGDTLVGFSKASTTRHPVHHGSLSAHAASHGGRISTVIDEAFTPLLGKMMLLQGFDYLGLGYYHHSGQFGNWHQTATQDEGNPDMASLDVVIADHFKAQGLPGDLVAYSASYQDNNYGCSFRDDGQLTTSRFHNPATLWDKYFANAAIPMELKELLVDRVLEDYQALKSSPKLGSEDRQRLEAHIAHLHVTEQNIKKLAAVCDQMRPDESLSDRSVILRTMNDVIVGLISCGLCHSFMGWAQALINENPDQWHVWSHQGYDNDADLVADPASYDSMIEQSQAVMKDMCLDLAQKLEDVEQLDDCLIVCIQEHNKRGHESWNVPVVTFGSAGGVFETDQYVDFRNIGDRDDEVFSRFGYPMNQLYANILRAMDMPVADFEALNKSRGDGSSPFKAGSGYGIGQIHPDAEFNMGNHYAGWSGHDMSEWLPQIKA